MKKKAHELHELTRINPVFCPQITQINTNFFSSRSFACLRGSKKLCALCVLCG